MIINIVCSITVLIFEFVRFTIDSSKCIYTKYIRLTSMDVCVYMHMAFLGTTRLWERSMFNNREK